ncbi:MAG: acyltransferase [Candidatus Kerfeldbacteria bacterium]
MTSSSTPSASHDKKPAMLLSLSVAKAVGIVLIIVAHTDQVFGFSDSFDTSLFSYHLLERLLHVIGHYGVSLFLVASGFGLTYSLCRKGATVTLGWYLKRFMRIYLLFWVSYAFFIALFSITKGSLGISGREFVFTLLGIQAFFGYWGGHVNGVYWFNTLILSLYAVFPLLFWFLRTPRWWKMALLLAISIGAGIIIIDHDLQAFRYLFIDRLFEFGSGIALAVLYHARGKLLNTAASGWLFLAAAAAVFAAYLCFLNDAATVALVVLSGPLLFIALFQLVRLVSEASLTARAVILLERYAHALFLFHLPLLSLLWKNVPGPKVEFLLVYATAIAVVSIAGHHLSGWIIEKAFRSVKRPS